MFAGLDTAFLITAFVTLFVVIDPVGLTPIFVAITRGMTAAQRRAVALRACVIAVLLLIAFGLLGEQILAFIGISMPAFKIAGGLLLFLTALDMLFERRTERREGKAGEGDTPPPDADPSVFPLAMPLIAGPGAMTAMILLTGQASAQGGGWAGVLAVHVVMLAVVAAVWLLFLAATPLERGLGRTGVVVITRLLGMLLAALSVQFVIDGLADIGAFGATSA